MKLEKGDKLLVFGMGDDMVTFAKLETLRKIRKNISRAD